MPSSRYLGQFILFRRIEIERQKNTICVVRYADIVLGILNLLYPYYHPSIVVALPKLVYHGP